MLIRVPGGPRANLNALNLTSYVGIGKFERTFWSEPTKQWGRIEKGRRRGAYFSGVVVECHRQEPFHFQSIPDRQRAPPKMTVMHPRCKPSMSRTCYKPWTAVCHSTTP